MPTREEREVLAAKQRIDKALKETEKKIKLDDDFWKAFKGRVRIVLETKPEEKFSDEEFREIERNREKKKLEVEIGGVEKRFDFSDYTVHAFSSRGVAGAGIFLVDELVGYVLFDSARKKAKVRATKKLLSDASGNVLFNYLSALFSKNLAQMPEEVEKGRPAFEKPLKLSRAVSAFSYLLANKKITSEEMLEQYVTKLAEEMGIDPISCCNYLLVVLTEKEQRAGISKLQQRLTAEAKNILKFWEQTKNIKDTEERVKKTSELAGIDPITCCTYLLVVLTKEQRAGISKLQQRLIDKKKRFHKCGTLAYYYRERRQWYCPRCEVFY